MSISFLVVGALFGALAGMFCNLIIDKKFGPKTNSNVRNLSEREWTLLFIGEVIGVGAIAATTGCGTCAQIMATLFVGPFIVGMCVVCLREGPQVIRWGDRMLNLLVSLTISKTCEKHSLQKRIKELETELRKIAKEQEQQRQI